jgi:hypothetical protein
MSDLLTIDDTADDGTVYSTDSSVDGEVCVLHQHSGITTRLESAAGNWNDCHARLLD